MHFAPQHPQVLDVKHVSNPENNTNPIVCMIDFSGAPANADTRGQEDCD